MVKKPAKDVLQPMPAPRTDARLGEIDGKGVELWIEQARASVTKARELLKPISKPRRDGDGK